MKFKLKLLNNLIFFLKIEELECTNYICDKIKPIIKFEKLHMYFKIKFVGEIFGWMFFLVYDIDIYQLNLGSF
jgi:hypothetical protein